MSSQCSQVVERGVDFGQTKYSYVFTSKWKLIGNRKFCPLFVEFRQTYCYLHDCAIAIEQITVIFFSIHVCVPVYICDYVILYLFIHSTLLCLSAGSKRHCCLLLLLPHDACSFTFHILNVPLLNVIHYLQTYLPLFRLLCALECSGASKTVKDSNMSCPGSPLFWIAIKSALFSFTFIRTSSLLILSIHFILILLLTHISKTTILSLCLLPQFIFRICVTVRSTHIISPTFS